MTINNSEVRVVKKSANTCEHKTEVYSRVVGFFRPVENWNQGKKQEFNDRQEYAINS
jgi:ribonucleoside-triphosphate reductase